MTFQICFLIRFISKNVLLFNVSFLKKICGEEHQYTKNPFLLFSKKTKPKKQREIINISYLIMVLIKIRLLIFLIFSQYGLASKFRIMFQISIYNWMQDYIL